MDTDFNMTHGDKLAKSFLQLLYKDQVFLSKDDTRLAAVEFGEQAKRCHRGPLVLLICEWISTENFCVYRNDKQRN